MPISAIKTTAMLSLLASTFALIPSEAIAVPTQIFDGRADNKLRKITDAESKTVEAAVSPGAKRQWKDSCKAAFEIKSVCDGAFTKPGAKQSAFLYSWCETGHALGIGGIAIMEKGRLAAHFGYDSGGEYDIVRVPDLDGDKIDDIAIVAGSTNQGYTTTSIALIGINNGAMKKFGRFEVYNDDSGAVEKNSHTYAWVISADLPAKTPVFSKQKFSQLRKGWTRAGKPVGCAAEKDEVDYLAIKSK